LKFTVADHPYIRDIVTAGCLGFSSMTWSTFGINHKLHQAMAIYKVWRTRLFLHHPHVQNKLPEDLRSVTDVATF